MPRKPPPSQWLAFLPFSGLVLNEPRIAEPYLFGDVTFASQDAFAEEFLDPEKDGHKRDYRAESYLVIRRKGIVNTRWYFEDRTNDDFMAGVRVRAKQIAALFTVVFLARGDEGLIVGLADQFLRSHTHFGVMSADNPGEGVLISSSGGINDTFIKSDPEAPVLSYAEVVAVLHEPLVQPLARVFEQGQCELHKTLRESIIQACVRLAAAIHATSYAEQLLGAVTSIEILLSGEGRATFAEKENRLDTLIGKGNSERYEASQIFKARHAYVHQGQDILTRRLPLQAICAATHALLLYARVAFELKTKGALVAYLDALGLASKLNGLGSPVVTDTINLAQMQREHQLPLADFVDAVKRVDEEDEAGMSGRSDRVFSDDDDYDFDEDE